MNVSHFLTVAATPSHSPARSDALLAARVGRPSVSLRHTFAALAAVALLYAVFIVGRLALHGADASLFVTAGDVFVNPVLAPHNFHVSMHGAGFDGQFYYRLALDPLSAKVTEFGVTFDVPAYRSQRIFFPVLAWALALGRAQAVPGALLLVNYVGLCAIGYIGILYSRLAGKPVWWGLLPSLYPGFTVSLSNDMTEIVETAFLMLGLYLLRRRRFGWVPLVFSLAVLARETSIIVPFGIALLWAVGRWRAPQTDRIPPLVFVAPLATFTAWQGVLWARWHTAPLSAGGGNFGFPLVGIMQAVRQLSPLTNAGHVVWLMEATALLSFGVLVHRSLHCTQVPSCEQLAWALYSLLAVCLTVVVWKGSFDYIRALTEWYVLGSLILLGSPRMPRLVLLAPTLAVWAILAALQVVLAPLLL